MARTKQTARTGVRGESQLHFPRAELQYLQGPDEHLHQVTKMAKHLMAELQPEEGLDRGPARFHLH